MHDTSEQISKPGIDSQPLCRIASEILEKSWSMSS